MVKIYIMTIFGLNSPEIFILLVIFFSILGPKRIEKLLNNFPGFIKFLLNDEKNYKLIVDKKEVEAPVLEEKEVEASNNVEKATKAIKVIPINMEEEQKVNTSRSIKSIKTKEKSPKKEKTPKPKVKLKKEVQRKKDNDSDKTI